MSNSKIEWLARPGTIPTSWSPVTGCNKCSPGCLHCYAERMSKRLAGRCGYPEAPHNFDVTLHEDRLEEPLRWKKPRTVFVCSMSDFFHPVIPFAFQCRILQAIAKCPQHTFILLTKRTEQLEMWNEIAGWHPYPNLWLGVTAENQEMADKRIPVLLQIPAAVRFVSIEPCLSAIDLTPWFNRDIIANRLNSHIEASNGRERDCISQSGSARSIHDRCSGQVLESPSHGVRSKGLKWAIVGAETGPSKRPMKEEWALDLRDQCHEAGVHFFFKKDSYGNGTLHGIEYHGWPEARDATP
ncbi:MAG: phage Gp37/Gp68 family protein, partial [Pseudomonadota bacterium]